MEFQTCLRFGKRAWAIDCLLYGSVALIRLQLDSMITVYKFSWALIERRGERVCRSCFFVGIAKLTRRLGSEENEGPKR